ncbi:hypothetical protein HN587_06950 [Candidatus Woesearchaeota archaeon]|jgi:ribonuclease P protein subunit RPR2|nr:hypothetical protein [Candidatus Woesearchaeota archaeon]
MQAEHKKKVLNKQSKIDSNKKIKSPQTKQQTRQQKTQGKRRQKKHRKKPDKHRAIANERINILFNEADEMHNESQTLANRYVILARKISMKYKVKLASVFKRRFCKHCYSFLVPGKNLRVRFGSGKLIYYCLTCKKFWRMPVKNIKKQNKKQNAQQLSKDHIKNQETK